MRYDAIVVGTGQSGPSLAVELAQAGRRVAVIERQKFGGTCVNVGCTPRRWWRVPGSHTWRGEPVDMVSSPMDVFAST